MMLLDSNIIIYSYQPAYSFLKPLVVDPGNSVSAISRLEILGFHGIKPDEQRYCEYIFHVLKQISVDDLILDEAIRLRKAYKCKIGDSIVAATALIFQAELVTRNVGDFKNIPGLIVRNPIL